MPSELIPTLLNHHFLIAMPGIDTGLFQGSLVYLCEHKSNEGAFGFVLNKPSEIHLPELMAQVQLVLQREDLLERPVMQGGPMHTDRGFVLHETIHAHTNDGEEVSAYDSTVRLHDDLQMTTSRDILEALAAGAGPERLLLALGYASWGPGQLESELQDNAWLTLPASLDLIFDVPPAERYAQALSQLGLSAWMLSSTNVGHA